MIHWREVSVKPLLGFTCFEEIWVQNKAAGDENVFGETKKSDEGVGSPAEQGDAESWVVFRPETGAACRGTKNHPARGISLRSRAAHYPSHFFCLEK